MDLELPSDCLLPDELEAEVTYAPSAWELEDHEYDSSSSRALEVAVLSVETELRTAWSRNKMDL